MNKVVLVGTYRPENAKWIRERKLYNLPLPACGKVAFHDRITRIVLIAEGFATAAYAARLRDVVDRDWLKAEGYGVAAQQLNRRWMACDMNAEYNGWAVSRLNAVQPHDVEYWIDFDREVNKRRESIR